MERFFTELHAHTSDTSRCGGVCAKDLVALYKQAGASTVVMTDHLSPSTFEAYPQGSLSWKEKIDIFLQGYRNAKAEAGDELTVLLGMELRFDRKGDNNDYLVYGVTEEFLYQNPDLLKMRLSSFSKLAHKNGLLIFQAHPFRDGMHIVNPAYLDGVEIYNACVRHNSRNAIAEKWAKMHHLRGSAGSDFHQTEDIARGGILTDRKIETNADLLETLKSGNFTLVKK
ncbi:MAG: PHP domain-containing protein [Candidatus Fimenecus sp.]